MFYAVAAADNKVNTEEVNKLKEQIKLNWLQVDKSDDEFGTDAAYQIEIVFDMLLDFQKKAEVCLNDFKDFKKANESLFTQKVKQNIWTTVNAIAASFSAKNKSELIMLHEIRMLLN